MEQSVYSSKQVICLFPWLEKNRHRKILLPFRQRKQHFFDFHNLHAEIQLQGQFSTVLQSLTCNTTGMENYVKARMFSTINWIRPTCNWKVHMQEKFTILYSSTSTSLLQLQRIDSLNMALSFKKDKISTHFLFVLRMK